jgi:hypothetical protein
MRHTVIRLGGAARKKFVHFCGAHGTKGLQSVKLKIRYKGLESSFLKIRKKP